MIPWVLGGVFAALVGFVATELALRAWLHRRSRYYVWPPGLRLELHQDPEVFPQVERRVRFDVNADGERGGAVRADEEGLFRVLAAGGSAVECLALDQPTSWPGAVERLLNSERGRATLGARRVHVGNIGRSGIASRHLDLIFEHVLPQYPPIDLIIIMVGASDVLHWLENGAPYAPIVAPASVAETFDVHPQQPFGWKPNESAALETVRRLRRAWRRPVEVRERAGAWLPAARKMRAHAKDMRTSVPDPRIVLDDFERHLARLLRRAQAHAGRVLVVRQPWFDRACTAAEARAFWHGGVGQPWKQPISTFYTLEVLGDLMGLLDARAAAVSDELGAEHLDLRPILTPDLEHYYDFFHATPAGAAVIAQAVAAAVLQPQAPGRTATHPGGLVGARGFGDLT